MSDTHPPRPRLDLCLATSLDGKIAEKEGAAPNFTSRFDREKLFRLRAESDALLVGANTVRQEELAPLIRTPELAAARAAQGKPPHPAVAILTRSLNLPWESRYFSARQQDMFILTERVDEATRARLEALDLAWFASGSEDALRFGLARMYEAGIRRVLAEGGGTMVHALLSRGLVDRFYLTLAPVVLGGIDAPSLCRGPRLVPRAEWVLEDCQNVDGELHLT